MDLKFKDKNGILQDIGFLPNQEQLDALNSGITHEKRQEYEGKLSGLHDSILNLQENKQDLLESGVNIKTINNESLLGEGNINIQGGGSASLNNVSLMNNQKYLMFKGFIKETALSGNTDNIIDVSQYANIYNSSPIRFLNFKFDIGIINRTALPIYISNNHIELFNNDTQYVVSKSLQFYDDVDDVVGSVIINFYFNTYLAKDGTIHITPTVVKVSSPYVVQYINARIELKVLDVADW